MLKLIIKRWYDKMDNIGNIKNVYLYNKTLHNQVIKKRIIWVIASLLIILIFVFSFIYIETNYIVTNEILAKQWAVLWILLMVLAFFSFFCLIYNLFTLGSFPTEKIIFSDRVYATTNNDEILTFKFERNLPYIRYDLLKDNLLDEFVKVLVLQMRVSKENQEINQKIQDKNVLLNDLYECLNIINVYKVVEKRDHIEIICDYIDLINNTSGKKQSLAIYKYYDNWQELLNKLKVKKQKKKEFITQENEESSRLVTSALRSSSKSNQRYFHVNMILISVYCLIYGNGNEIALIFVFGIDFIISTLHCQKRALKYLHKDSMEENEFLLKGIKINEITLVAYSILLIVYLVIYPEAIPTTLTSAICIFSISFIFRLKIEK